MYASWQTLCLQDDVATQKAAHLVVFKVHKVGQDPVEQPSGFTISYTPHGRPIILRLRGEPIRTAKDAALRDDWLNPVPSARMVILRPEHGEFIDPEIEHAIHELSELKAQSHEIAYRIRTQHLKIRHLVERDFRAFKASLKSCDSIKCVFQTALRKWPEISYLISARFSHAPSNPTEMRFEKDLNLSDASGDHSFDMLDTTLPLPHPDDGEPEQPPPSSPFDGGKPPARPPHDDKSRLPQSPAHRPYGPPGDHTHGTLWPHHSKHHHFPTHRFVRAFLALLLLILISALIYHHIRSFIFSRYPRRRADHAFGLEERRARRAYRRAARYHKWSQWWSARKRPKKTTDYEEKRALILQQEGVLEDVMQSEIRNLGAAQEIADGMMRAEEGRARLYQLANMPGSYRAVPSPSSSQATRVVELDAEHQFPTISRTNTLPSYRSRAGSLSALPPPLYEEELEADMTVVDGFQYTPSNTGSTPASSIIDCSPRLSVETGRTTLNREPEED